MPYETFICVSRMLFTLVRENERTSPQIQVLWSEGQKLHVGNQVNIHLNTNEKNIDSKITVQAFLDVCSLPYLLLISMTHYTLYTRLRNSKHMSSLSLGCTAVLPLSVKLVITLDLSPSLHIHYVPHRHFQLLQTCSPLSSLTLIFRQHQYW